LAEPKSPKVASPEAPETPARRASAGRKPARPDGDWMRTSDLAFYHLNPRRGNVPLIVESLKAHGQYKPIIVNRGALTGRPNEVLAGNHLLRAGQELGWERMWCQFVDVDDVEAARIVAVDNRASDKGTYDTEMLATLLEGLPDLGGTGYDEGDLRRLLNGIGEGEQEGLTDPDDAPAKPSKEFVRTKEGDVWLLGPHRLVCGDSENLDVIRTATDGAEVDALWTDPPYGVEYTGGTKDALTIQNDTLEGLPRLLHNAFTAALEVLRPGAPVYVAHPDTARVLFELTLRDAGYLLRQTLLWVKNALMLGRSDYQYKHEPILEAAVDDPDGANVSRETFPAPILEAPDEEAPASEPTEFSPVAYGFTPGLKGRLGRGGLQWYGDNKQTTVFEFPKPKASREHPTMKPVDLIVAHLRNSTTRGQSVLDLFGGSGSVIIAAYRLGLIAYLIELEPAYCDVICRRWQEHTGVMPILERTGKGVDFTKVG
jgi:DNA modification methylase